MNDTDENAANVEDGPDRPDDGKALVEPMGGEVVDSYLTLGQ